ncbi:MAG: ATP-binding cassette domain-containing protein, partial [Planctomycetes bacterium]|nr:ATP-binding cassette domain-containing protein [Planctomycetota bacterium]
QDERVLEDVSFKVEAGEHIMITGPSGSGKTTLLNLIPRFYDVDTGTIRIDGRDIEDFTLSSLRDQIGIVFQDCFLFNSSVMENIRYARPDATDEEVVRACQCAEAHEFISDLSNSYYTRIGEEGIQLSAGEAQRLVIARTILKEPVILILDEALSSLDPESREKIADGLFSMTENMTVFAVTHHTEIFPEFDKILRVEEGTVSLSP